MSNDVSLQTSPHIPLTVLSDEEQLFRDSCRSFAEERIRPLVRRMDEEAKLEASLIPELFQLGLMGIHVPEAQSAGGPISGKLLVSFQPNAPSQVQLLSDRSHRAYPSNNPVHPYNIGATVFHALGIDHATEYRDTLNRPRQLVEHGGPIVGLF